MYPFLIDASFCPFLFCRLQTDDRRQVMAIAHTGELKRAITPKWVKGFTEKL
jgi:hypothetical protein